MRSWMAALFGLLVSACMSVQPQAHSHTQTSQGASCSPEAGLTYICGPRYVEDFERVPGTDYLIGASLPLHSGAGGMYLFNTRTLDWRTIPVGRVAAQPDAYPCAGPPDWTRFVAHGLAISERGGSGHTLFVVNHGGREAIEVFTLSGNDLQATWIGCVLLPAGVIGNGIAPTPQGGLLITATFEPVPFSDMVARFEAHQPVGGVYEWRPGAGVKRVIPSGISGPNGVALSADGSQIFVAGWGDHTFNRFNRATGESTRIDVGFRADNVHYAPDGTLVVAGQLGALPESIACGSTNPSPPRCSTQGMIMRIDPNTMRVIGQWRIEAAHFGDLTVAYQVDGKFWLGTLFGDRVAVMDASGGR